MIFRSAHSHALNERLTLVAGGGDFPCVLAKALKAKGKPPVVFAVERGEADEELKGLSESYHTFGLGDGARALQVLEKNRIKDVLFAGKIEKRAILDPEFEGDAVSTSMVRDIGLKGDANILKGIALLLKMKGIRLHRPADILPEWLTPQGCLTKRTPTRAEEKDIRLGCQVLKAMGSLDIGQTVIIKSGTVVAVEAMEGTSEAIRRGGKLTQGIVVVKLAKPRQDLRLDMPVAGPDTLDSVIEAGCRVLALHAGKSLMLFKDDFIRRANQTGVALVGVKA